MQIHNILNSNYHFERNQRTIFQKLRLIYVTVLCFILFFVTLSSCKKLIEVGAPNISINASNVYSSDATAAAVLTGIYTNMSNKNFPTGGITSMSLFLGLTADELTLYNGVSSVYYNQYYRNGLASSIDLGADFWYQTYPYIFTVNSAIEGLNNSTSLTPAVKQQLMGEAKFIRAFCYFYLVSLYGDVPLALSTDWKVNTVLSRSAKAQVWQQIITDLKDAQSLLNSGYLKADGQGASTERVRPTKWGATALLARVYLYTGDYANAEAQASSIINNTLLFSLSTLNSVFLKNSTEAIWQLQPVNSGQNTQDALLFIIPVTGPTTTTTNPVYLSSNLLNSFESGDQRKNSWTNSVTIGTTTYYYPFKYKVGTLNNPVSEYLTVFRLGEQYLIRSEARAQQNNISGAQIDLNMIRNRAGLVNTASNDKTSLLSSILHERQVELFTEWGHRWLDLKRTNTVDAVMSTVTLQKGGNWNTNWQWFPIPISEIQYNPNLVQNVGY